MVWALISNLKPRGNDYRIGIFADDGIAVVSFSKSRKMVNLLKIGGDSKVWIPEGMGWYRSEVVKKILFQENRRDLYDEILFYNFGFVADKIVTLKKVDNWRGKFWWRLKIDNLINKSEELFGDNDVESDWLNEVMLRDFSESKVFDEDLKVSVVNISGENGLAGFITNNLERLGFWVVSVSTGDKGEMDNCAVLYGDGVAESYSWVLLKRIFSECDFTNDISLNAGEVELYFDDKFTEMINYSSYKR